MYQVTMRQSWDGEETVIHSARSNPIKLPEAQVTLDTASIPGFSFDIYPGNPGYDALQYMTTLVTVRDIVNQYNLFEGRVLTASEPIEQDGMTYSEVACEGLEAFLKDSRPGFVSYSGKTRSDIFSSLISLHNAQMKDGGSPEKCFKLGAVSLGTTKVADCYTDESASTYDNLSNLVLSAGYELSARHESDGLYLDCAKTIGETGDQIIELKRNLITFNRSIDPSNLVTAFKPLGAQAESTDDASTDKGAARLTIASVNGGNPLLRNESLIGQFGLIVGSNTWDDITSASTLKTTGQAYFNALNTATISTQVQAIDMSFLGKTDGPLRNGWTYRTRIPFKGIDEPLRIKQSTIDINNPSQSTFTMGDRVVGQETYNVMIAKQLAGVSQYNSRIKLLAASNAKAIAAANAATQAVNALKKQVDELSSGTSYYTGSIIDVSEYQGSIDWSKVVGAGLALAVIRVQHGYSHEDLTYKTSIPAAIKAGANYGVYAYFAATDADDAADEAASFYSRAEAVIGTSQQPRLWMIDVEEISVATGTMRAAVSAYMDKLNTLGVPDSKIVLYIANQLYTTFNLDVSRAAGVWIPSYGANDGTVANSTKPLHPYDLWQYTSKGVVPGITANTVDMSTDPSDRFKAAFLTK